MATTIFYQVPAHGHVNPSLGLVSELVRRGERVIYYLTEEFRGAIEATGAEFRPYPVYDDGMLEGIDGRPFKLGNRMIDACRAMVPGLIDAARADQPAYIMHDAMAPWGWMVAKNMHLPSVSSMALIALHPRVMIESGMMPAMFTQIAGSIGDIRQWFRTAASIKRDLGLQPPSLMETLNAPGDLTINFTSTLFQPRAELFTDTYRFVGPAIDFNRPAVDFPFEQLNGKPLIYVALGTVNNEALDFYRACFHAFADDDWQVVLSIGKRVDPSSLGTIPGNFIVRQYVPQLDILKRASLFVTHGGLNSIHEGLYFDVPLVVVPQTDEQALNGKQVVRLGAGEMLRKRETSAGAIGEAAERVLENPRYKERARIVGDSFRAAGGVSRAADEIFAFVGQGTKVNA